SVREGGESAGEGAQAELLDVGGRLRPRGCLVVEGRDGSGGVQRRHSPVEAKLLRLRGEATRLERRLERTVLAQDVGGLLRPDAGRARELVRRIPAQRDEIW